MGSLEPSGMESQLTDEQRQLREEVQRFASRVDVAGEAVQVHGGAGFVNDHDVERVYRDAKITQIYEGTTEIQKHIVARELHDEGI